MTRKDYELIAACIGAALADVDGPAGERALRDVTNRIALEMSLDNPRFKRERFNTRIEYWRVQHGGG